MNPETTNSTKKLFLQGVLRLRLIIHGAVQGMGFRPFVFRLAQELGLMGWVSNSTLGVLVEVEGREETLKSFQARLEKEKPSHSFIQSMETAYLDPAGYKKFEIRESQDTAAKTALVLPDIATCPECFKEIFTPANRRYLYPFTNCTHCGPRYSILEALPYDRRNTTMKHFELCPDCRREYEDPANRRFHAQPNACPACGPHLELWDRQGNVLFIKEDVIPAAARSLSNGGIVALKGLGGFQLMVDARNEEAIRRLRRRKQRDEKPFALMVANMDLVKNYCLVSALEERLLRSSEAPIVLLERKPLKAGTKRTLRLPDLAVNVAPDNPYLGLMLPYTPLHHLLLAEVRVPLVMTSGNLSSEPICIDEFEALQRLKDIAELFLVHDRPIARPVDDSVVRVMAGRPSMLRRSRGYAPLPVSVSKPVPSILAVGGHLKNTVALSRGREVFLSQHIGDLDAALTTRSFEKTILDLENLLGIQPETARCDLHPDYHSTKWAEASGLPVRKVQHHLSHVLSCMAENELSGPALGVAWDGTGYGTDKTVWGGEFFAVRDKRIKRLATFRTFPLPGGDKAVQEPGRAALGLLFELLGKDQFLAKSRPLLGAFSEVQLDFLKVMLDKKINSPVTSSVGRLFDAAASLAGLRHKTNFEGQTAMELEFCLKGVETDLAYRFGLIKPAKTGQPLIIDWGPLFKGLLVDVDKRVSLSVISAKFHNALVEVLVKVAKISKEKRVVLSGGCFQNKYLTERAVRRLAEEGFKPYWHQRVPCNDGGIALGQVVAASR